MATIISKATERIILVVAISLLTLFLIGCASSTQLTGSWRSPDVAKPYGKIVVVALTDQILARQEVESDLQMQLRQRGIEATRSIDIFPPAHGMSKDGLDLDLMMERLHSYNYDAILTAALIDEKTETHYVPGYYDYYPMAGPYWYGWYGGYYAYWYPMLYQPGYYTEEKIYYLETNLYDTQTEQLMWSAQSRSYSPSSLRKAAEKFSEITVDRLSQDRLVASGQQQQ
ncbi:hypothetical protein [Pontibacter ruber]|uniref:DUF4136 domain-containing protein n=1 Tax=Pontibacter ruber TaxID=1343895 RepID=A0ABW5D2S1_9BACT|nr:hypothetical protein [Pontibacter ruber]